MVLASNLLAKYHVPICIINGAYGGTPIFQHQPNPTNHLDTSGAFYGNPYKIYGCLLMRVTAARLTHGIRGVLWHQGENDSGSGVQSCYRGPRLYDADEPRILVQDTVAWYKKYRAILDSDIIHVRRPDGRDIDCMLHVNPRLKEKGLATVYNPLPETAKRTLRLPLYYTGLTGTVRIREREGASKAYLLDREFNVQVPVVIPPRGSIWLVIE